jgi:hypothetical protein
VTERVIRFINALTGEPFNFAEMIEDMIEERRATRLAAGETTWPDGTPLDSTPLESETDEPT